MLRDLFSRKPAADAAAPATVIATPAPVQPPAAEPAVAPSPSPPPTPGILDAYLHTAPTDQSALDLFKGEWASRFPPPFNTLEAGGVPLFQDTRIPWALDLLGGVQGQSVLELGPLEGGHSYMMEKAGAASVIAIEANTRAYLKCLIAKEVLDLKRVKFLCGDFMPYLEQTDRQFDLLIAAGVLYHMKDPVRMLQLVGSHTRRTHIWTHYYDAALLATQPNLSQRFTSPVETVEVNGVPVQLHRQNYMESLASKTYCGGGQDYSVWLTRDGLLSTLRAVGFTKIETGFDQPDHPHGPAIALVASKE